MIELANAIELLVWDIGCVVVMVGGAFIVAYLASVLRGEL